MIPDPSLWAKPTERRVINLILQQKNIKLFQNIHWKNKYIYFELIHASLQTWGHTADVDVIWWIDEPVSSTESTASKLTSR